MKIYELTANLSDESIVTTNSWKKSGIENALINLKKDAIRNNYEILNYTISDREETNEERQTRLNHNRLMKEIDGYENNTSSSGTIQTNCAECGKSFQLYE
jgi:hypothetical protein